MNEVHLKFYEYRSKTISRDDSSEWPALLASVHPSCVQSCFPNVWYLQYKLTDEKKIKFHVSYRYTVCYPKGWLLCLDIALVLDRRETLFTLSSKFFCSCII